MKAFLFFSFLFFLFEFSSAFNMEISPNEVYLESIKGLEVCEKFLVRVSEETSISIEDRWAEKGYNEKILTKHKLSAEELSISCNFKEEIFNSGTAEIEICFNSKEVGFYHGVVLMKAIGKPVGVGAWINLNVLENKHPLTGLSLKSNLDEDANLKLVFFLLVTIFLLALALFFIKRHNP